MTRKQFDEWVEKMVARYRHERFFSACETRIVKNVVICIDRNHKVGIAKCHPDDEFNPYIGTAIAYARMRGIKVPKVTICKKLSEMKNGDIFYYDKERYVYIGKRGNRHVVWKELAKDYFDYLSAEKEYEMVD